MRTVTCLLSLIVLVSCEKKSTKKFDKLEKMNWLIGNWELQQPDGLLVENWKKVNDSTFSGESYFINPKDTIHFETILLKQKEEELLYSATVTGQNDDEPVDFNLTSDNEHAFTFENPAHDYPQKITYKKVDNTTMIATISGNQQGKPSQESYTMKRK